MATSIPHQGSSTQGTTSQGQSGLVDRLAQTAEQTASRAVDRVKDTRERAEAGFEKQHQNITTRIRDLGDVLRSSGKNLDDNEQVSALLNIASDQVERLAQYVDNATPRSVARDIERFARERPAWFFGGAFLAGLALGRFAKSSRETGFEDDGMQFSEGGRSYSSSGAPQSRGGASSTYTGGASSQGASYSGYTSGGSATTSGPYTGGATQRMGSGYPGTGSSGGTSSGYSTGSSASTYTGSGSSGSGGSGAGYSNANSGSTLTGTGSNGYGGSSTGASYSGSSASGSAASPSGTTTQGTTTPSTTQTPSSAPRANNNNGSTGSKS